MSTAHGQKQHARYITRSKLSAPSSICMICDKDVSKLEKEERHTRYRFRKLIAHHWNGYDNPSDVWWICYSCNSTLANRHDGSLTLEQARNYVLGIKKLRNTLKSRRELYQNILDGILES